MTTTTQSVGSVSTSAAQTLARPPRSLWRDAGQRLLANRLAQLGMLIVVFFLALAIFVPILFPYNPRIDSDLTAQLLPPSFAHPMGTDEQGRDVMRRIAHGAQASLGVGIGAVLIAVIIGTVLGLVSGYLGHTFDLGTMFVMDILLSFPGLLLAIAIVAIIGPGLRNSLLAISIVSIPIYARIARSSVLSLKQHEFISAAQAVGAGSGRIITRHIFPNSLSPVMVAATLGIAAAILETAALGFLGLGQQPPYPEWGAMLADSVKYLTSGAWWVVLFPGLMIMLTVLGFNLLGDGLRDALDPRLKNR
ncbi:MAG: putative D,D-dipeptide transport system permease protein DdpC [Anaerolineae bacterium]|nr:putative D,D-dipeptide transport system permease protein DdpC [Anaerolineae bacterium]MDL1895409.1 ABC transporter permease [Anaerolineae bacterium CFX7]